MYDKLNPYTLKIIYSDFNLQKFNILHFDKHDGDLMPT